jgi:hypothetical protein
MFERVGAKKTEKGVAVFMRAYGTCALLQNFNPSLGVGRRICESLSHVQLEQDSASGPVPAPAPAPAPGSTSSVCVPDTVAVAITVAETFPQLPAQLPTASIQCEFLRLPLPPLLGKKGPDKNDCVIFFWKNRAHITLSLGVWGSHEEIGLLVGTLRRQ